MRAPYVATGIPVTASTNAWVQARRHCAQPLPGERRLVKLFVTAFEINHLHMEIIIHHLLLQPDGVERLKGVEFGNLFSLVKISQVFWFTAFNSLKPMDPARCKEKEPVQKNSNEGHVLGTFQPVITNSNHNHCYKCHYICEL